MPDNDSEENKEVVGFSAGCRSPFSSQDKVNLFFFSLRSGINVDSVSFPLALLARTILLFLAQSLLPAF